MLVHANTLVSLDVLDTDFVCNLSACKGACCVEGESGAPLDAEEIEIIAENLEQIKPFMSRLGLKLLEQKGFWEKDTDGDLVTNCLDGKACLFAINEGGIHKCSIEKSFLAGKIEFKKPISCHLYPVRLAKVGEYMAINYSKWDVCDPACKLGASLQVPVYRFLKESLVRKFGQEWYDGLDEIAQEFNSVGGEEE
jgi:hypothetical protein